MYILACLFTFRAVVSPLSHAQSHSGEASDSNTYYKTFSVSRVPAKHPCRACSTSDCRRRISRLWIGARLGHDMLLCWVSHSAANEKLQARRDNRLVTPHVCAVSAWQHHLCYQHLCQVSPMPCAVLCCAVLHCAALCCAVLRCAALCCAGLCCAVLRCAALRCAALPCAFPCSASSGATQVHHVQQQSYSMLQDLLSHMHRCDSAGAQPKNLWSPSCHGCLRQVGLLF